MRTQTRLSILILLSLVATAASAQRELTYKQVDEPHPYYWREMYIQQLTTGPSSVAWTPDSKSVVYSMAGSLWRQSLDAGTATQLTAGPGYDYQPDCSPDGRWLIYTTYQNDALELFVLEVESGRVSQLTQGGAVNVEPRFSPDSKRIVFVSTSYNGRFHIFTADFGDGKISNVQRLTGEERTTLPRYYYSAYDHEISPVWSPDGTEIIFISNRGHLYGTGGLWRMKAVAGAERYEIYSEETTWKARPDWSPDGKRVVFSSYAGRNWHHLWVLPAEG
ncbi:MAG: PD40 domain-containing protein, partial [Acidobacteria bacterium]|nr:PD40 domain-containing protein [Acidobacteriota bacterium]